MPFSFSFPVYAILFSNILFSSTACLLNFSVAIFNATFQSWVSVFVLVSQFAQLYHVVCWSIISVLRYFYIIKSAWLFNKFPDQKKLTVSTKNIFFSSAFFWDFSLWLDRLSSGGPPTLGAALLCSSWAGTDMWLYPELITLCL